MSDYFRLAENGTTVRTEIVGTVIGACMGTSTVTSFIESAGAMKS